MSYSDTGLAPSTSYSYRVRAKDAVGNLGPYSNMAATTTHPDRHAAHRPGEPRRSAFSSSRIDLSWSAATDDVGRHRLPHRAMHGRGCSSFVEIAAPAGTG